MTDDQPRASEGSESSDEGRSLRATFQATDGLAIGLERGLSRAQLRRAVHDRVFGRADPVQVGRYTVLERVGSGAMSVVVAAYDNELDRKVAIKVLRVNRHQMVQRLLREATALAKLSHPNVVQVYEVGEHEGEVYMAMELVRGTVLGAWLSSISRPWREVVDVFIDAARGLAAAHAQGIIHRDFKPDNVIVGDDGRVRVLDFGLARGEFDRYDGESDETAVTGEARAALLSGLTQTGAAVGTPGYMAPEQIDGATVDSRADQFSLCVALYEALCGQRPFDGDSLAVIRLRVADGPPSWPMVGRRLPAALGRVVLRGLSESPDDRFASMDAFIDALARVGRSRRFRAMGAGMLVLGLVGAWWWSSRETDPSTLGGSTEPSEAERRVTDALVLEQARGRLKTDPTEALERLAALSDDAPAWDGEAWAIAAEAWERGVAQRVWSEPEGTWPLAMVADRLLVAQMMVDIETGCSLRLIDETGVERWAVQTDCGHYLIDHEVLWPVYVSGHHALFHDVEGVMMVLDLEHGTTRAVGRTREADGIVVTRARVARTGVVVRGARGVIQAWGVDGQTRSWTLPQSESPRALEIASDDASIIVASLRSGGIEVIRSEEHTVRSFEELSEPLAVSDDGAWVIARRGDVLVRWRVGSDRPVPLVHGRQATSVSLSADGRYVAATDATGSVVIIDATSDQQLGRISAHEPERITLSADGRRVAFVDEGRAVVATTSGQVLRILQQDAPILRLHWVTDDEIMTGAQGDGLRVWSIPSVPIVAHEHRTELGGLAFAPDGSTLLSAGNDRTVRRWSLDTGQDTIVGRLFDRALHIDVSSDGHWVLVSMAGGRVFAWDGQTEERRELPEDWVESAGFGRHHEVLYVSSRGFGRWDLDSSETELLVPGTDWCGAQSTAAVGLLAASCRLPGERAWLEVWSTDRTKRLTLANSEDIRSFEAELDPQGRWIVYQSDDGADPPTILMFGDGTKRSLGLRQRIGPMAADGAGARLLGQADGALQQWRPQTGLMRPMPTTRSLLDNHDVTSLRWDREGNRFAVGTRDGRIFVVPDPVPTQPEALRAFVREHRPERTGQG
ncbi:MAG: WD40 repeat domain-containing serine/threonine protein kinase [Myxococcota bacterium]